jgi:Cell morphogenesis C-terminal/Cell morphogenesis central region
MEIEYRHRIDAVLAALSMKEGKRVWNHEDITPQNQELESTQQLSSLALELLDLFSLVNPNLKQMWSETALQWACNCSVRHFACRSLQIFRTLKGEFSQRMLNDTLHCLAANISDDVSESQGFALELLETLYGMVGYLSPLRIDMFPQIFWAAIAGLSSTNRAEVGKCLQIVRGYLTSVKTRQQEESLLIYFPTKWKGEFTGIVPLVMPGLYSVESESESLAILRITAGMCCQQLVGDPGSILAVSAHIPRLVDGLDTGDFKTNEDVAGVLAQHVDDIGMSRVLQSYALQRFRSRADFVAQYVNVLRASTSENAVVEMFLNMLSNTSAAPGVLFVLEVAMQDRVQISNEKAGWISGLVQLLEGPDAVAAGRVLECVLKGRFPHGNQVFAKIVQAKEPELVKSAVGFAKVNIGGVAQTCGTGHDLVSRPVVVETGFAAFETYFLEQLRIESEGEMFV